MKYVFPIFQYCRETIYLLTNARTRNMDNEKIRYKAPRTVADFFTYIDLSVNINKWIICYIKETYNSLIMVKYIYPVSQPTRKKCFPWFPLQNRTRRGGYNTRSNIRIVDIHQKFLSISQRRSFSFPNKRRFRDHDPLQAGTRKAFCSIRRKKCSQKMFQFQIAFPS